MATIEQNTTTATQPSVGTIPAKFVPDRYKHNPARWTSEGDWGLRLEYEGPAPHTDSW